ncbi:MAG: hypothetical protein AB1649_25920 [Chloroflexota bacterium]
MSRPKIIDLILAVLLVFVFIVVAAVLSDPGLSLTVMGHLSKRAAGTATPPQADPPATQGPVSEQPVTTIPLTGPVAASDAELSGLAWYGDALILLPQFPDIFDEGGDGFLYYLPKAEILAYIDGQTTGPLEPRPIQLIAPDLRANVPRYQGFEAIGFSVDRVFLTIESGHEQMMGYLISGRIEPDLSALTLDTAKWTEIPPPANFRNRADEALLVLDDRVLTFYELYGVWLNPTPTAHVFDSDLQQQGTLSMPSIEYRITDAAPAGGDQFWAINYFLPADLALFPSTDPIADTFGEGPTHAENYRVERLLKLQITDSGIALTDTPPVQLVLNGEIRNWEGLALLDDRGFLLATDKYPSTLLAFVPMPE